MKALPIGLALLILLGPAAAGARVLWERGEVTLEHRGSFKQIVQGGSGTSLDEFVDRAAMAPDICLDPDAFKNCPGFGAIGDEGAVQSLSRLRNRLELRVGDAWTAVAIWDHQIIASNPVGFERSLGGSFTSSPWADIGGSILDREHVDWDHDFYRLYVDYEGERLGATVGRQRVAWGVGRLWNPIDRFNASGPLDIEPDEDGGVDAINLRWNFTDFTFLQGVCAFADDREEHSCALRFHGVLHDVDFSVVAGSFERALTLGFDLEGNLGDAAGRVEVVYTHSDRDIWPMQSASPEDLGDFWQVVVSVDYMFDVGNGIYALIEHLYNGNALGFGGGRAGVLLPFFQKTSTPFGTAFRPVSRARFGGSRVITASDHTTGLNLGYDLTPEIRGDVVFLYDWEGQSASFFPSLRYDAFDWLELTVGGQFFVGPRMSQYGDVKPVGFLIAEFFF